MTIVGCDFHPGWQQVAVFYPETGEVQELKLANGNGDAERFYRRLPAPSLVGIEGCGNTQWFEELLERLGHELWIGDAAKIRASFVRKQKTDRRDAAHILKLLMEDRFPRLWRPSPEDRDLRQLLIHRHKLVSIRARVKNGLQHLMLNPTHRFRVKLRINEKLRGLVRTDSLASIATEGVVGGTYVLVLPGKETSNPAPPLYTLPTKETADISKALDRAIILLNDADTTINDVRGKVSDALTSVTATVGNVNQLVLGLKQGRGPAGMLLQDEKLASQIRNTVSNTEKATQDLSHAVGQADSVVADLKGRNLPAKVDESVTLVKSTASNLNETSRTLKNALASAMEPDKNGVDGATNIRESISSLNVASANMADNSEALKHNFLFRGFFKKRGYYNLSSITPSQYRKEKMFTNPSNRRLWIAAGELFEKVEGDEVLSERGKRFLDRALAGSPVVSPERILMIEGYSDGGTGEPSRVSTRRAIQIKTYLIRYFGIDRQVIGTVSMKDAPPKGLGKDSWDGISLVFISSGEK